jgi:zinc protease
MKLIQLASRTTLATAIFATAMLAQYPAIDIPFQKFTLPNGLTVIVHEDHKAPIVAVNIWYHVGSKNEKPGKTGFAHLFEHLMFNGSEHFNTDYFKAVEKVGATDLNGTTNEDRTNYFQNVPVSALDLTLWLESDRMGHLVGVIDQPRLDEQRGVVQNEKRQGENQPYAVGYELATKATYPAGHPYSWTVIGSMEDLNAASLADVKEWFKTYYGPQNAVLVLAGDIDAKTAREKVERYFGAIPAGPPIARHTAWIAKRTGTHRQVAQDRVPQSQLMMVWNVPGYGTADNDYLDLVTDVLASGKTSRLYKRLVYQEQIATDVSIGIDPKEIGGQVMLTAMVRPGESVEKVEKAAREELAKFIKEGPTAEELERVKTRYFANLARGIQRIGGFGGKSDLLATNEVFAGDAAHYKVTLDRHRMATAKDLRSAAEEWLSDGVYVLEIHPYPKLTAAPKDADRTKPPGVAASAELKMPKIQRKTLANGMKVLLAERHDAPIVNLRLALNAGYAGDQFSLPGTAKMAMDLLDEGTKTRNALQISDEAGMLGATITTGANLDESLVTCSALKPKLDQSLSLWADIILNPVFPDAEFKRIQKETLSNIQQEQSQPFGMLLRVLPGLYYGHGHAYGNGFSGSGTEGTVKKLTVEDMRKYHATWFKPSNATITIVGDTTMAEIEPKLEKLFNGWKQGDVPTKNLAAVPLPEKSVVYLLDKPGAIQSIIAAGHLVLPRKNPDEYAIDTMNTVFGGAFISRINMNLREDKHWSYGAGSQVVGTQAQRPFFTYAPVQTDKTKESIEEMMKEVRGIVRDKPVTAEELEMAQSNKTLRLPGSQETMQQLLGAINEINRYQLPDDYFETYASKIRALKREDLNGAAEKILRPDRMIWVVVGDRSKVEQGIRDLHIGDLKFLDADGNPVQ